MSIWTCTSDVHVTHNAQVDGKLTGRPKWTLSRMRACASTRPCVRARMYVCLHAHIVVLIIGGVELGEQVARIRATTMPGQAALQAVLAEGAGLEVAESLRWARLAKCLVCQHKDGHIKMHPYKVHTRCTRANKESGRGRSREGSRGWMSVCARVRVRVRVLRVRDGRTVGGRRGAHRERRGRKATAHHGFIWRASARTIRDVRGKATEVAVGATSEVTHGSGKLIGLLRPAQPATMAGIKVEYSVRRALVQRFECVGDAVSICERQVSGRQGLGRCDQSLHASRKGAEGSRLALSGCCPSSHVTSRL